MLVISVKGKYLKDKIVDEEKKKVAHRSLLVDFFKYTSSQMMFETSHNMK